MEDAFNEENRSLLKLFWNSLQESLLIYELALSLDKEYAQISNLSQKEPLLLYLNLSNSN